MGKIKRLPGLLIDKIAAGEVVERPASVVKELVENSLDAGAKQIQIHIRQGGKGLIRVSDDGCGMSAEDCSLAVERHATSKIYEESDLFRIATLGFRGEALPSIASIARLTIETKERGALSGTRLAMAGGALLETREAGCAEGTDIQVEQLFYNTPARLKFLKSDGVELGHIDEILTRLAIGAPEVGFTLRAEERTKWQTYATPDPLARMAQMLPPDWVNDLIEIHEENPILTVRGWIAHPRLSQSHPNHTYFYLNGRFLKDRVLQHALQAGFDDYLMRGRTPVAVLFIKMDPTQVDVNVHPAKREVRFQSSGAVHDFLMRAVRKGLQKKLMGEDVIAKDSLSPCGRPIAGLLAPGAPEALIRGLGRGEGEDSVPLPLTPSHEGREDVRNGPLATQSSLPIPSVGAYESLRVLGQLAQTYLVCESPKKELVLIDQHAAHERIGYDQLKKQLQESGIVSQRLLVPLNWEVSAKTAAFVTSHLDVLRKSGLDIEPFGANTFAIQSAPVLVPENQLRDLLEKLVAELELLGTSQSFEQACDAVLKTISCHKQVRASDGLSHEEMNALLKEMDTWGVTHCPHGRPVVVRLDLSSVEKWCKRT